MKKSEFEQTLSNVQKSLGSTYRNKLLETIKEAPKSNDAEFFAVMIVKMQELFNDFSVDFVKQVAEKLVTFEDDS